MAKPTNRFVMLVALGMTMTCGNAHAQAAALGLDALTVCANQVLQLRTDSPRLARQHFKLDAKREEIMRRGMNLQAEAARLDPHDLASGLDLQQRQKRHNDETNAFNADIEQLKREIGDLNRVKADYDQRCSQRSYRRRDLETLPPAARDAMRAGMDDVQVPYVDAATIPLR